FEGPRLDVGAVADVALLEHSVGCAPVAGSGTALILELAEVAGRVLGFGTSEEAEGAHHTTLPELVPAEQRGLVDRDGPVSHEAAPDLLLANPDAADVVHRPPAQGKLDADVVLEANRYIFRGKESGLDLLLNCGLAQVAVPHDVRPF